MLRDAHENIQKQEQILQGRVAGGYIRARLTVASSIVSIIPLTAHMYLVFSNNLCTLGCISDLSCADQVPCHPRDNDNSGQYQAADMCPGDSE